MKLAWALYLTGVVAAALAGFLSPLPFLGFLPLSAGLIWAAYDLVEVPDVESSTPPQRTF